MEPGESNIALIYFSRRAYAESRKKSWFPNKAYDSNRAIASSLILQTSGRVRESGLPIFHYHEGNQKGATFGERLANAYQDVFNLGYQGAIAIGNDTPEIADIKWAEVSNQLQSGKCVIGPSLRGGAYLIGITAEVFNKQAFQKLPWQTNKLFTALTRFCTNRQHNPYVLKRLRDINSYYDLQRLVKNSYLGQYFKRLILRLLSCNKRHYKNQERRLAKSPLRLSTPLRGPPQNISLNTQ